jgi:preprotein translocase SecF subunit
MRPLHLIPPNTKIPFMAWRKAAMSASLVLVLVSAVLAFYPGLNFGIDFKGGVLMEVRLPGPANLAEMRGTLGQLGLGEVALQELDRATDVLIRVERQPGDAEAQNVAVRAVRGALGESVDYRRVEFVGPAVSGELIEAGTVAVTLAVVLILVYIWFRFEWHFGAGAVIALLHDVLLSIGMFAVTQLEFNLSTIAALLTIVGYSINDTVVVYDRVRENLRKFKAMPLVEVLNGAINDTLSRTTMTSVTTLLALFTLFLFGGEVIRGFVAAMIWGVLIGTYSSVFIAAPLLVIFGLEGQRRREAAEAAAEGADERGRD